MSQLVSAVLLGLLLTLPAASGWAEILQSDDFESGFGSWTNAGGDDIDWTRDSGGTPSSGTGPSGDHTTGSGFYLFTESSTNGTGFPNKVAILESPCIDLSGRVDATWSFWYQMDGAAMGTLNAEVAAGCGTTWTNEWSLSGDQGASWAQASVDLTSYVGTSIKLRFRGVTGSDFTSDMTVDDVEVDATTGSPCTLDSECDDGVSCTADTCVAGFCENASTCTGSEICDPGADMCVVPPAQQIVDSLDLVRFKSNIQKLSSQEAIPEDPEDPIINGSRHWSQPGNAAATAWIESELVSYGYTNVVLDDYEYSGGGGVTRYNVYATKIGTTHPQEMYIVSAHFDSKTTDGSGDAAAAGADDDASGTSAVLEAARVFASPDVETEYSIRFAFWNNEETGLNGSAAYVSEREGDRGVENPPGSGEYPEPAWRGMIQHDMILYDHGYPNPTPTQSPNADVDIEYDKDATFGGAAIALANALLGGNVSFATDYPAEVTDDMSNTDSARFQSYTAAVSMREDRRLAELGNGSNPNYHTLTDVYESYSDLDYLFGFNVVQTTVGTVAELAGATVVSASACGDGVLDAGEDCDDGNTSGGDCCSATCSYETAGSGCADGDVCNGAETCDGAGTCDAGAPLSCDDGAFCNGAEVCDPIAGCQAGTPIDADDEVGCTDDSCDEVADTIVNAVNNGNCDDSDVCNGLEVCDAVLDCQSGSPLSCDDGTFCNGAETCDPATGCQAGTPVNADDGVACTDDSCDEVADTIVNAVNNAYCDDADACNGLEVCDAVLDCQVGTPLSCDDGAFCNGTETCDSATGCEAGTAVNADDGVACTDDSCDEVADTIVNAVNNANCDDADLCNGLEVCDAALDCQVGTPLSCDDGAFCNGTETCDPAVGCEAAADPCDPLVCDEGADACVACIVDADCGNGLYCDGVETCSAGVCNAGTPPSIDDGVSCTDDSCDEATDSVVNAANAANCDNGLFCDGAETCDAALDCQAGTPPSVDDFVSCTDDSCDEATDSVVNSANNANCDNGQFCDGAETCDAALDCQAGTPPSVDDGVGCTDDSCDEATDSVVNAVNDANCENGLYCDGTETCDAALDCQAGPPPPVDDGVVCTDDSCDEATDSAANIPNDGLCDDGDACTADSCDAVTGCANDPILGCTVGFTAYNDCVYDPGLAATGTDPEGVTVHYIDSNVTTIGIGVVSGDSSSYTGGSAYPTTSGILLDHASGSPTGITATLTENASTNVQWQPQVAATWHGGYDAAPSTDAQSTFGGKADMTGVTYYGASGWWVDLTLTGLDPSATYTFATTASRASANTDGAPGYDDRISVYSLSGADASTNASTAGVTVISPTSVSFSTGNNHAEGYVARWTDIAPGVDGTIVIRAEADASAPEGRKAYAFDVFMLEETGQAVCGNGVLEAGEGCDDGNGLDGDCCSSACQFDGPGTACDDADACTDLDTCDGAGVCVSGAPVICDDGGFCNGLETCDSVTGCQAGTPPAVDDSVTCTDDSCDEIADVIVNTPNDGNCDDGQFCDGAETCDALLDCQAGTPPAVDDSVACTLDSCDEAADVIVHAPDHGSCGNGQFCDGVEVCDLVLDCQAGAPPSVDDGVVCTDDSCDEGADAIVHATNDANCENGLFCDGDETCDAALDCQAGSPPNSDDGVGCTDDICDEGTDTIVNTANDANCDDGEFCDGDETCDAVLDCQAGSPPSTNDGLFCTDDSCDDGTDTIVNAPNDAKCDDFDPCTADSCDAVTGCAFDPIIGCADTDGDGIADSEDNCPDVSNPGQADGNGNGVGDACESVLVPATTESGLLLIALMLTLAAGLVLRVRPGRRLR